MFLHSMTKLASISRYLAVAVVIAFTPVANAVADRPNVVLIVIDTLRADALSCYGYVRATTPRMDAFAEANVRFHDAIAPAGATPPTMAAMMSGRLPFYETDAIWTVVTSFGTSRFSEGTHDIGLPRSLDTVAEILQRNGYATSAFVSNPFVGKRFQFDQGFDVMEELVSSDGQPHERGDRVVAHATEWLDSHDGSPFFLYVHLMDAHYPYLPPEEYRRTFSYKRIPGLSDKKVGEAWETQNELDGIPFASMQEHVRGLYDGSIFYADEQVGVLLDALADHDGAGNTLIVITSDHGEEFLEHGDTSHKGKLYDEHVRVPLLIQTPDRQSGLITAPVQNFDIMPTILEYSGIDHSDPAIDAVSLRPLIEGQAADRGRPVVGILPRMESTHLPHFRSVRTRTHKLLYCPTNPELGSELFDLKSDPGETMNLYDPKKPIVQSLHAAMNTAIAKLESETLNNRMQMKQHFAGDIEHGFGGIKTVGAARFQTDASSSEVGVFQLDLESGALELASVTCEQDSTLLIRARFVSPADTKFEVTYEDVTPDVGRAVRTSHEDVRAGDNTILMALRPHALQGGLRIRPGTTVGNYRIESLEVAELRPFWGLNEKLAKRRKQGARKANLYRGVQRGAISQKEWEDKLNAALKKMSPEQRAKIIEAQQGSKPEGPVDEETRERLEALGYVD